MHHKHIVSTLTAAVLLQSLLMVSVSHVSVFMCYLCLFYLCFLLFPQISVFAYFSSSFSIFCHCMNFINVCLSVRSCYIFISLHLLHLHLVVKMKMSKVILNQEIFVRMYMKVMAFAFFLDYQSQKALQQHLISTLIEV